MAIHLYWLQRDGQFEAAAALLASYICPRCGHHTTVYEQIIQGWCATCHTWTCAWPDKPA